jgi:hypothetical protein
VNGETVRKLHLAVGVVTVIAFLLTGQFMAHHAPPLATLSDSAHLMFRSRHIYILGAGLVNLMLGLYFRRHAGGWRRTVQVVGSAFLIVSPALLILAFIVEPQYGLHPPIRWSAAGLYLLFGGSMAHLLCGVPA